MKRIGIFGGSFNPIHKGHVGLAEQVCKKGLVDEVWLMVSPLNPLKQNEQSDIIPFANRLKMAKLATANHTNIVVSDFEAKLPQPSYTITTLNQLQKTYPGISISLIIGEDNWQRFGRWYKSDEIRAHHDIIVYGRNESAFIDLHHPDNTTEHFSDIPIYDISSTAIRKSFREGKTDLARKWLHKDVYNYILQQNLLENV